MILTLNGQDLGPLLVSKPQISDQLESVCRTLTFSIKEAEGVKNFLGQRAELWYGGKRWYVGFVRKRGRQQDGVISYTAYDPLIFLAKNVDDWYFKSATATQNVRTLASASGIRVKRFANTGAVLPPLYYQGADGDKVTIDQLSRTYEVTGKRYWYRYDPDQDNEGLDLFERVVPSKLWAFQVGVNLTGATYEESIEDTITVVKLVNRDTGHVVTKVDDVKLKAYGKAIHFEEVDKDAADSMDTKAKQLLDSLSRLAVSQQITGINPDQVMPQFFSGDFIYVEEKYTRIMGGYHIRNITQTFESDSLITINADIEADPYVPEIQFTDATKNPNEDTSAGVNQNYSPEVLKVLEEYGL